jgi:hypothetical protein
MLAFAVSSCQLPAIAASIGLYVTGIDDLSGNAERLEVLDVSSTTIVRSWLTQNQSEFTIAVDSTVRTLGATNVLSGSEYTYGGTFTGTTYHNTVSGVTFTDGTEDATHNYALDISGRVYAFDLNWQNPMLLFTISPILTTHTPQWRGIAYDATNNSLWAADSNNAVIGDFTLGGTLLSHFSAGVPADGITGLGLNPNDQTLWVGFQSTHGRFDQFNKSGSDLQTETFVGLAGFETAYMEFGPLATPEPAALLTVGMGLVVFFFWCLRRESPAKDIYRKLTAR